MGKKTEKHAKILSNSIVSGSTAGLIDYFFTFGSDLEATTEHVCLRSKSCCRPYLASLAAQKGSHESGLVLRDGDK